MEDVAKTSKNPTCSANSCFLSRKRWDGERPGWSWDCWSAGSGDERMGEGSQSLTLGQLCSSPSTAFAACPSLPAPPGSSPSPLRHFCFIYEYVSGIQMSYLFCGRLTFPQRASACLTHGPAETAREEKQRAKEFFSALFYSSPHPIPGPHLILFCVCACVSGALLPGRAPLARPLPAFIPLALL